MPQVGDQQQVLRVIVVLEYLWMLVYNEGDLGVPAGVLSNDQLLGDEQKGLLGIDILGGRHADQVTLPAESHWVADSWMLDSIVIQPFPELGILGLLG